MSKNKLIITIPNDTLGGAEYFLKNISTFLASNLGYEATVVFLKKENTQSWDDLNTLMNLNYGKVRKESLGLISLIYKLFSVSRQNTKLVISSHAHLNGLNGLLRKMGILKTKYLVIRESNSVYDRHRGLKLWVVKFLHKYGYDQADLIICQTPFMKQRLIEESSYARKWKIEVLPNPIKLDSIIIKSEDKSISGWQSYGNYIVAAGRLIKIKGFEFLLEAFSKINDTSLNLVILGEGDLKDQLKLKAIALNIEHKVFFPGFVSNPMPYFKNAVACVVSSILEGFPNVLLQMMALNEHVISTRCAGGIENIEFISTCNPEDSRALTKAINQNLDLENESEIRKYFDDFLKDRSLEKFVKNMFFHLNDNN